MRSKTPRAPERQIWRYLAAWLVMLLVSVTNGAIRDFTYGKHMTELAAHQLSTLTGILLLGFVIRGVVRRYPPDSDREALLLGLFWLGLTVVFEFVFFHYAGGHPWSELLGNYNIMKGRVWVAVLVWVAVAPYLFFRLNRQR